MSGGRPKPRKLSAASDMITPPTLMLKMMMIGAAMLGSTWRSSERRRELPIAPRRLEVDVLLHPQHGAADHARGRDAARHPQHDDDLQHAAAGYRHDGEQQQQAPGTPSRRRRSAASPGPAGRR